ncbi:hypothetical protein GQ568_00295, partial [Patescibacteria group bacterium]|nr:hypothetical protein [Patescibacteria group bacterium]
MRIKQVLKFVKNEIIYGGHLLSLGAASIIFTSAVLLDIKVTWDCLFVTYLGIQAIYLYDRYKKFEEDILTSPERANHLRKYLKYLPIIIFFIILIFVLFLLTFDKIYPLLLSF